MERQYAPQNEQWTYRWVDQVPLRVGPDALRVNLFLAFLFHTTLHLSCPMVQAIRHARGARRNFFDDLRALTLYFYFPGWDEMITFMAQKLRPDTG